MALLTKMLKIGVFFGRKLCVYVRRRMSRISKEFLHVRMRISRH